MLNDWKKFEWVKLPLEDLKTEEGETRYYIIDENTKFPSMTSILGLLDDGGIDEWRERVGEEEADKIVKDAVARGNNLHDLSERYLMNTLERKDVQGPGSLLFNRSRKNLNMLGPIIAIEAPLYSRQKRYAGRVDCIAFEGSDLCIVDHKNSRRAVNLAKNYAQKKLVTYIFQLFGYATAFKEMFPKLPAPTHGVLLFGNFTEMSSSRFKVKFNEQLAYEFDLLIAAYYGYVDIKQSVFFDKDRLLPFIESLLVEA